MIRSVDMAVIGLGASGIYSADTIEEYNKFCNKGHDDLFAKDMKYLRPLKEPKYYALKCNVVFLGTLEGIKVTHKMEAVDKKDIL